MYEFAAFLLVVLPLLTLLLYSIYYIAAHTPRAEVFDGMTGFVGNRSNEGDL